MTVSAPQPSETVSFSTSSRERGGRRRVADVRVDLDARLQADRHRVERAVVDVRGDDHAPARDLRADELGVELLALGDALHLRRDDALAREVHLRDALRAGCEVGPVWLLHVCSLRWHDPDQVRRVGARAPSQPLRAAPRTCFTRMLTERRRRVSRSETVLVGQASRGCCASRATPSPRLRRARARCPRRRRAARRAPHAAQARGRRWSRRPLASGARIRRRARRRGRRARRRPSRRRSPA